MRRMCWPPMSSTILPGPPRTARFLGPPGAAESRNILVLARLGGRVVGFASGTVLDHPDTPRNLFVQELGVNEEVRRRGIASALLAALRAGGRARGCLVSWVLAEAGNLAARATHAASGGSATTGIVMHEWTESGGWPGGGG
jgi:GNAT superfamily N-acetyltransferase